MITLMLTILSGFAQPVFPSPDSNVQSAISAKKTIDCRSYYIDDKNDIADSLQSYARKEFLLHKKEPHVWHYMTYLQTLEKIHDTSYNADDALMKAAYDVICNHSKEKSSKWLNLIPTAVKMNQWMSFKYRLFKKLFPRKNPVSIDKVQTYLADVQHQAKKLGVAREMTYEIVYEWPKRLARGKTVKDRMDQLDRIRLLLNENNSPHEFAALDLAKVVIYLEEKDYAQAEPIITKYRNNAHPGIAYIAKELWVQLGIKRGGGYPIDFKAKITQGDGAGEMFQLSKQRGKVVVLDFWQSWCSPCLKKLTKLDDTYKQFKEKKVIVVGISNTFYEKSKSSTQKIRDKHNISYPQIDQLGMITERYYVDNYPYSIIIDTDGRVKKCPSDMELGAFIDKLVHSGTVEK